MNGRQIIRAITLGALLSLIAFATAADPALANLAKAGPGSGEPRDWTDLLVAAFIGGGAASLLGHLLGLWRDWVARTYRPRIEIAIECRFFRPQGQARPVELCFMVTNKGGARTCISKLAYWIRGIDDGDELACFETDRLEFPKETAQSEIEPLPGRNFIVDPGTTQSFARPVLIPVSLSLILVHLMIETSQGTKYTEERVLQVASTNSATEAP